jgi:hypothetical protein
VVEVVVLLVILLVDNKQLNGVYLELLVHVVHKPMFLVEMVVQTPVVAVAAVHIIMQTIKVEMVEKE